MDVEVQPRIQAGANAWTHVEGVMMGRKIYKKVEREDPELGLSHNLSQYIMGDGSFDMNEGHARITELGEQVVQIHWREE